MKLTNVKVRNYRCLKSLDIELNDYTALVGANGSGKSSLLYALNWFFNGGQLSADDLHCLGEEPKETELSVEISFSDLNDQDRQVLGRYGRGSVATFRRSWSSESGKEKMIGNAMQGPGFSEIRANQTPIAEMRRLYREVRATLPSLADVTAKEAMLSELEQWESNPGNGGQLIAVDDADATHMFGFAGEQTLAQRVRFVLIPAAADIASEVGNAGRGSALATLVGSLMKEAVASAKSEWESKHAEQIRLLEEAIQAGVVAATRGQATRVNTRLQTIVPNAKVEFSASPPAWSLSGDGSLKTDVVIDGLKKDVSRQGHGIQRAVMIAMLQAFAPDQELTRIQHQRREGETEEAAQQRLEREMRELPGLIVAIEEPEIYQHPVRARSFARVLNVLAREGVQVLLATHSPYFVLPEQFSTLRRFSIDSGETVFRHTTASAIALKVGKAEDVVRRAIEREIPQTFAEGFFADAVVSVEGATDRAVLEVIAARLNRAFDASGIAILEMGGKGNLHVPVSILAALEIPVYVLVDGDAAKGLRKHPNDPRRASQVNGTHEAELSSLLGWLPASSVVGSGQLPYKFGSPTVIARDYAILQDDLESELSAWPSFVAAFSATGRTLREDKDVAAYRSAAIAADMADMPDIFKEIVNAAHGVVS